jgi:hypothetical protein
MDVDVAGLSPIEARMGDDEFEAGEQEGAEGQDREPVGYADQYGVAGFLENRRGGWGWHRRSIPWSG